MDSSIPLVSILIPVYNVEKYLCRCLNSMVNQTLDNIEILVVNDGSPDNSQIIIDEFTQNYPSKVFSHKKENSGQGSARNYGLELARGDYIGFIDGDDYARPDMFEKMYKKAKQTHADLIICEFDLVDEDGNHINSTNITGHSDLSIYDKCYAHRYASVSPSNKLFHRDLFFKTRIRFPHGWFEDYAATPLLVESAHKIDYIEESLLYYVQRKGSTINQALYHEFSKKNYNILKMTDFIIQNRDKFAPANFQFFMDEVAPFHAFLRFALSILKIENKRQRADVIKRWGKALNRLIPRWYRSTVIKNKLQSMPFIRRLAMMLIIIVFRFSIPFVIYPVKFNYDH